MRLLSCLVVPKRRMVRAEPDSAAASEPFVKMTCDCDLISRRNERRRKAEERSLHGMWGEAIAMWHGLSWGITLTLTGSGGSKCDVRVD